MKMIGMIGGMSWESSADYYRIINEAVKHKLGGLHSAKSLLYSVDFAEIEKLQHQGKWKEATKIMVTVAKNLEKGGADFIIICTNTMHKMADDVQRNIKIPLLHIVDPTAEKIKKDGLKKIGLLGTKFTMEEGFYKDRLIKKYNLEVLIPNAGERRVVHDIIFKELCLGKIKTSSRKKFQKIIDGLAKKGVQGIILGCTEIASLINQKDSKIPLYDTTLLHAIRAVEYAFE